MDGKKIRPLAYNIILPDVNMLLAQQATRN